MRKYALEQTDARLRRLAYQLARVAKQPDAEAIHDLRVSIRRFSQCLRVFRQFFPSGRVRRIRRRLKGLMALAAEVRNQDIALELWLRARVPQGAALLNAVRRQRAQAEQTLLATARRWSQCNLSRKWRTHLEL
jgi:CHAD domain-containing protein